MIWNFIAWCCFGFIAGGIARFLYPGPDRLGCFGTIALGYVRRHVDIGAEVELERTPARVLELPFPLL